MDELSTNKNKSNIVTTILWVIFFITLQLTSNLPGLTIPGLGFVYPFRIILPIVFIYFLITNKIRNNKYSQTFRYTFVFLLILLLYGIISLAWAQSANNGIKKLLNFLIGLTTIAVMVVAVKDKKLFYKIILINTIILFVFMFMGIYESFTGNYFFHPEWKDHFKPNIKYDFYYPIVGFPNPNDFVFVLFAFLPFVNMMSRNLFTGKKRIIGLLISIIYFSLYILIAFLASCRVGMVMVAIYLVVKLLLVRNIRIRKIVWASAFFLILIVVLVKWDSIMSIIQSEQRFYVWRNALLNAEHYYFMGTGPGNAHLPIEGIIYEGMLTAPHFWFLEILVEFGLPVFIPLLVWYGLLFKRGIRNYDIVTNTEDIFIKKAALEFLICFIPMSIMSASISDMPQFWLILSFVIIAIDMNKEIDCSEKNCSCE